MILTNSEISCFQRCAREWQHRYVDHRTGPSTEAQSRGTRVHRALAALWDNGRLDTEGLEPVERAMVLGYAARWSTPHITNVRTSVPFAVELTSAGVTLVGELDALGIDPGSGRTVIVEHKTTTQDVTPGSQYWQERISCDPQVSTYARAYPNSYVLYDVLRVPALRPLEANSRRKVAETSEEYTARCLASMSEEPDKYFQRALLVRLESERDAFDRDVQMIAESMHPGEHPRNPKSCFSFGRKCDFFGVCWSGDSLEALNVVEKNHTEQIVEKVQS